MDDLRVSIIQSNLFWEDKSANLARFESLIERIEATDLIILPEMFSTGFTMNVQKHSEPMSGETVEWMQIQAQKTDAVVVGSIIVSENQKFYNRLIWATPEGKLQWYDKRHLFSIGQEHLHFTHGNQLVTMQLKGWKIRPLICYDLRFPVWSRNYNDYDVLLYVANWPAARHHVWKNLLVARALENQCWCIGVNRVGCDGMQINYNGDSGLVSPKGDVVWLNNIEKVETFTLIIKELQDFRMKFPVLSDRDEFQIFNTFDQD